MLRPNVPVVPVAYTTAAQQPPVSDAAMLAASVRLRVEDPQATPAAAARSSTPAPAARPSCSPADISSATPTATGKIDVDVYGPSPPARLPGRLVAYDLERDVGLVAFRPQGPVMVARVAPPGYAIRDGDAVASVGCNNGEDPTVQHSRINSLDRFQDPGRTAQRRSPPADPTRRGTWKWPGSRLSAAAAADSSRPMAW